MDVEVACDQVGEVYLLKGSLGGNGTGVALFHPGVDVVESKFRGCGAEAPAWGVYVNEHGVGGVFVKAGGNSISRAEAQGKINSHSGPC